MVSDATVMVGAENVLCLLAAANASLDAPKSETGPTVFGRGPVVTYNRARLVLR